MYADKSDVSPQMCYDAVWDDEVTCDQAYHSLCEKTCSSQYVSEPPMECIAAQRSLEGNYVRWVRGSCLEENHFVCERPQTYDVEMEQFLPSAYGTLPLSKKLGPREAAQRPLQTWETNVGYDDLLTPASMLGSALFGGHPAFEHSYVEIKLATDEVPLIKEHLTIMLWFKSTDVRGVRTLVDLSSAVDPTVHKSSLNLDGGAPLLKLHDAAKKDKLFYALRRYAVTDDEWHFIAFSFDSFSKRAIVVLDDHVEKFATPGAVVFDRAYDQHKVLVGGNRLAPQNNFRGAVSCVQFYPASMSESAIFSRKYCEKAAKVHRSPECPEDLPHFWKGDCFKVSGSVAKFSDAEIACMPFPVNSLYDSRLVWPSDRMTLDHLARLVEAEHGTPEFWVGLDWLAGGAKWQTSYGEESVDKTDPIWETGRATAGGNDRCASTAGLDGGRIKAHNCLEEKPYVCMTAPLYKLPDNKCPRDHHSYKGDCYRKSSAKRAFADAVSDCAGTGGIVYAPKTSSEHEFLAKYATGFINSNIYIGVSKGARDNHYNLSRDTETRPLAEIESPEAWSFTDGTPFNSTGGYRGANQ